MERDPNPLAAVTNAELIRRIEHAEDFGYDDEQVELNKRLETEKKAWKWNGNRVEVYDQYTLLDETVGFWHRQAVTGPLSDEFNPHRKVEGSRYGKTAGELGWFAVGSLIVVDDSAGLENHNEAIIELEFCMNWAREDHPALARLIVQCWGLFPEELTEHLGTYERVRGMCGDEHEEEV